MKIVNLCFSIWFFMIGIFASIGAGLEYFKPDAKLEDVLMLQICAGTMFLISKMFSEASRKERKCDEQ